MSFINYLKRQANGLINEGLSKMALESEPPRINLQHGSDPMSALDFSVLDTTLDSYEQPGSASILSRVSMRSKGTYVGIVTISLVICNLLNSLVFPALMAAVFSNDMHNLAASPIKVSGKQFALKNDLIIIIRSVLFHDLSRNSAISNAFYFRLLNVCTSSKFEFSLAFKETFTTR